MAYEDRIVTKELPVSPMPDGSSTVPIGSRLTNIEVIIPANRVLDPAVSFRVYGRPGLYSTDRSVLDACTRPATREDPPPPFQS